jgi:hypothetical protein
MNMHSLQGRRVLQNLLFTSCLAISSLKCTILRIKSTVLRSLLLKESSYFLTHDSMEVFVRKLRKRWNDSGQKIVEVTHSTRLLVLYLLSIQKRFLFWSCSRGSIDMKLSPDLLVSVRPPKLFDSAQRTYLSKT